MTKTMLEAIHAELERIETAHKAKRSEMQKNRERAIALIHFISDIVNAIAPGEIEAIWYGSYKKSGVANYPRVRIYAKQVSMPRNRIAEWEIDAGGEHAPPQLSKEDIERKVLEGLSRMQV